MEIVITEWALQTYLDLKHRAVFSDRDYWDTLRPDVELLHKYPVEAKFSNGGFWGPATDRAGNPLQYGHKMKWHNLGPGAVQLRLCVALYGGDAYLCQAYVKSSEKVDKREMAKFKDRIRKISLGQYTRRGTI